MPVHEVCQTSSCGIKCIADLESDLARYVDELSRVFFKKENLRNKSWWLSVFYSLCIQALVRNALSQLGRQHLTSKTAGFAAKTYLHLAVRLFIANSGKHDPLASTSESTTGSSLEKAQAGAFENEAYQEAKTAVQQSEWHSKGIASSAEYLKRLFEVGEQFSDSREETSQIEGASGPFDGKNCELGDVLPVSKSSKEELDIRGLVENAPDGNEGKEFLDPRGAATSLFLEPIARICNSFLKKLKVKKASFPLREETKRGVLRLFGRGEGIDQPPGYDATSDNSDRDKSDRGSMSSCGSEEWGQIGSRTPTEDQSQLQNAPEAMPDFRRTTVCNLVESYKAKINIVYPIFSNRRLDMLVEAFLRTIPPDTSEKRQYASSSSPGRKRKRSPVASDAESISHGPPFRSISTALVLLVLALGKICRIRGKIPGPVPDETNRGRRRRPIGDLESWGYTRFLIGEVPGSAMNVDIIPGLRYFSLATDILGNHLGGNNLTHVHANVLASLFHGQPARPLESHAFIYRAGWSLQALIKP
jgi:hypothetical protein